jgi:hypothetical protein
VEGVVGVGGCGSLGLRFRGFRLGLALRQSGSLVLSALNCCRRRRAYHIPPIRLAIRQSASCERKKDVEIRSLGFSPTGADQPPRNGSTSCLTEFSCIPPPRSVQCRQSDRPKSHARTRIKLLNHRKQQLANQRQPTLRIWLPIDAADFPQLITGQPCS